MSSKVSVFPEVWQKVPDKFRHCLASRRHDLDLHSGGTEGAMVVQWWKCDRCGTDRLTVRDVQGNVEHTYSRPADYGMPEKATSDDCREWLLYEARRANKDVPAIDLVMAREVFGDKGFK